MAGYSGTPLPQKLGIKPGHTVLLAYAAGAPADDFPAVLEPLPPGVTIVTPAPPARSKQTFDVILAFVTRSKDLAKLFAAHDARLAPAGGLWVVWPKKEFREDATLTEDALRAVGLKAADGSLVDNKVCAVTDRWSGLRFVRRVSAR